jgi:hypothetical protein
MDNIVAPTGTWTSNAALARVSLSAAWGDLSQNDKDTKLTVTVNVQDGTAGTIDQSSFTYSFSGLKSAMGQPFFVEYTNLPQSFDAANKTKVIKNTLDFKIRAGN